MTTLITRLYDSKATAQKTADRLYWIGFPRDALTVVTGTDKAEIQARLTRAEVPDDAAPIYAKSVAGGTALLVIRAGYRPLCAAQIARDMTAKSATLDVGVTTTESKVKDRPEKAMSVLKNHPRFLTSAVEPGARRTSRLSNQLGMPLLTKRRERTSAISGGRHMSKLFWPMKLLSKDRNASSAIKGGRLVSRAFWPLPHLSQQPRRNSVIPGGGPVFSRTLGLETIVRRG